MDRETFRDATGQKFIQIPGTEVVLRVHEVWPHEAKDAEPTPKAKEALGLEPPPFETTRLLK